MSKFQDYIENFVPAPSEPLQFRAIGLVQGIYAASEKEPYKGALITSENPPIDCVTLGKVSTPLGKKDCSKEHLFVVYPRTKPEGLHLQIMGVWDKKIDSSLSKADANGYFNIRGNVVYQSKPSVPEKDQCVVIQIRQSPKKGEVRPKFFKLKLKGKLPEYGVNCFWDIVAKLVYGELVIQWGTKLTKYDPSKAKKKKKIFPKKAIDSTPIAKDSVREQPSRKKVITLNK